MATRRRVPKRKKPLQVDKILAAAAAERNILSDPAPTQQSYAGWSWEDGIDPYAQPVQ